MWNAQAVLARGSMAAAFHTPFQTASKQALGVSFYCDYYATTQATYNAERDNAL